MNPDLLLHRIPDVARAAAEAAGFRDGDLLFSVRSDLDLQGGEAEDWTVVSPSQIASFVVSGKCAGTVIGPHAFAQVEKVHARQNVGSSFLALRIEGLYVEIARYANTRRESFGRVATSLQRRIEGKPLPDSYLEKPSE